MKYVLVARDMRLPNPDIRSMSNVAFERGVPYRANSRKLGNPYELAPVMSLACDAAETPCGGWPWVFEEGRAVELPAEEIFAGFGGLDELFTGDLANTNIYASAAHEPIDSKVGYVVDDFQHALPIRRMFLIGES